MTLSASSFFLSRSACLLPPLLTQSACRLERRLPYFLFRIAIILPLDAGRTNWRPRRKLRPRASQGNHDRGILWPREPRGRGISCRTRSGVQIVPRKICRNFSEPILGLDHCRADPVWVRSMDIGEWLRGLGLGQYETAFRENAIDGKVLPKLTSEDLKELGVASVGHRRTILSAIAELSTTPAAPAPVAQPTTHAPAPSSQDAAERRQLTVMFCDLVGSTAMSARLDPEDMREVISAYHRCCSELIERNGGFVAKYMGDGVLAYFGYPQAHEHDAERAVRAGLAIVYAAPKLEIVAGAPLHVRVGIATGLVVVGDLIGSGEAQERGIVGDTPNLAARLQSIAEPDTVVIAEGTRRLLGNLFEFRDLGGQDLKGISGSARAWAAVRATSAESRFEALHATGLTALVGREEELELLLRRWSKAKSGEGQVAVISGEAGIGKSRLTAALLERLADEPHTRLRYFCSPQHTDSAFYPIIGQMERAAGLAHDDAPKARLDKLEAVLARTSTSVADAALFAEMLSLPNDGRYPALVLTPPQRRQRTLEALVSQVEALTRLSPVLMIFEDAHWTDPTSLDAFGRTVDRIAGLRALLIVTFRPDFEPPWIGRPHVSSLTLNRLTQREIDAMIDRVVGNKLLPADVRRDIVERTDGIPLFAEEMTKAVLEAEGEGEARRTVAAVASPSLAVPASLHASLMARLDRLGPAKEMAQIGAAIGREFSHTLLAEVSRKPGAELALALDRLIAAGLLFRAGRAAPCDLSVQARSGAGRGLWHAAARAAPRASRPYRRCHREPIPGDRGEPAGAAGAPLHRGWADRQGRAALGQSRTEIAGTLGARGGRGAANPRTWSDRGVARHARSASRADQASSRAHNPTQSCRRHGRAGDHGSCGAGASIDRTSRSDRRASRRPLVVVLSPLWLLGCELRRVQRRRYARSCDAVPGARREASGDNPANDRASPHGYFLFAHGRRLGRPGAFGSGARALRSCRASPTGDAIWPRRPDVGLILSVVGLVVARLSGGRSGGRRAGAPGCARDQPSRHLDVRADP